MAKMILAFAVMTLSMFANAGNPGFPSITSLDCKVGNGFKIKTVTAGDNTQDALIIGEFADKTENLAASLDYGPQGFLNINLDGDNFRYVVSGKFDLNDSNPQEFYGNMTMKAEGHPRGGYFVGVSTCFIELR